MEEQMAKIVYEIAPEADQWFATENGVASYVVAEAAFEVAAAKASIEMHSNHDIVIHVRQPGNKDLA
jgi:hypothetical protein